MPHDSLRRLGLKALLLVAAGLPALAPAQEAVRIGAPLALTGGLADEGKKQQAAYELWLERINAAGGIAVAGQKRKVELVFYDYQTDEKRAQQLAERLINVDKVQVMTAPFGSGHTKVVAGVAERYGIPIVAVASAEPVHNQGYKNLFGTLAPSIGLIDAMLAQVKDKLPATKRIAVLGRDDVFPKVMATTMAGQAQKAGYEVVYNQLYPVGTLDHAAALTQMKAAAPDWIFVTGYTKDLVLVRKQMADLRLAAPVVTMITGPAYREFVDSLGPLAENVTSATWWHPSQTYKADDVFGTTQAFADAVRKKTGQDPDYVHASSAAALIVIQKAIEKAGSLSPDALRKAIAETDLQTFYGPIRFRGDGMNENRNLPIIQIQGGKPMVLFPLDMQQAALKPLAATAK
ncbi:amino acid ABC transporter substrate-binding protein [Aquabacterium sp. J223]|uniref:amino acid ABC transporter substrate-binding protein n=1 Tax=Aquabacterium sp. J223 TaxID=2898431 RepID=UPI0021AE0AE2|nr:amino acid ABC transporter substrate-binding protein [Aquabacterium sp. J223]UUX96451.1 amino acid ABC transporter substrate-binding protein [Aquabacterium sp. J223]